MIQEPLPPILRRIDLEHDIDLALALRRAGRTRRQENARKGWRTRRDSGSHAKHENSRSEVEPEGWQSGAPKSAHRPNGIEGFARPHQVRRRT